MTYLLNKRVNQIIFQKLKRQQISENSYVFTIKSDDSYQKFTDTSGPVLKTSNPNRVLYGICFYVRDFIINVIIYSLIHFEK